MCKLSACISSLRAWSAWFEGTFSNLEFFTLMLSLWPVCSGYVSVPDAYAQHVLKGLRSVHELVPEPYSQCTHLFLTRILCTGIISWREGSAYTLVPDVHAKCTHQFLTRMFRVYRMNIWQKRKTDAHAENARKELKIFLIRYRQMVSKASQKNYFCPNSKKSSLKLDWAYA